MQMGFACCVCKENGLAHRWVSPADGVLNKVTTPALCAVDISQRDWVVMFEWPSRSWLVVCLRQRVAYSSRALAWIIETTMGCPFVGNGHRMIILFVTLAPTFQWVRVQHRQLAVPSVLDAAAPTARNQPVGSVKEVSFSAVPGSKGFGPISARS